MGIQALTDIIKVSVAEIRAQAMETNDKKLYDLAWDVTNAVMDVDEYLYAKQLMQPLTTES